MREKPITIGQSVEIFSKQEEKPSKQNRISLRKKAVSELSLDEAIKRLVEAEKTIEKQKRKILELTNVVLRRPEWPVRRKA